MRDGFPGVELCHDVRAAEWVRTALRPWTDHGIHHVATLVPVGYPAYVRLLHRGGTRDAPMRWRDIAARTGQRVGPETSYRGLVGAPAGRPIPAPWAEPEHGSLLPDECEAVAEVLARHTTTPDDCYFCLWAGYGTAWTTLNRLAENAPRVALEHRDCLLFRGPVIAATAFRVGGSFQWFQSPTLWWPADRAWCVASELDIFSTYVAASERAVGELLDHPSLEGVICDPETDVDHGPYD